MVPEALQLAHRNAQFERVVQSDVIVLPFHASSDLQALQQADPAIGTLLYFWGIQKMQNQDDLEELGL